MLTSTILRAAAVNIRRGWCQKKLTDGHGNVCAVRAITMQGYGGATSQALRAMEAILPDSQSLVDWNNAPDQTQENVALAFELAAVLAEQDERADAAVVNADLVSA